MRSDTHFRIALAIVFFSTIAVTAYHRWQAASGGEKISRKGEGLLFAVVLRAAGLLLFVTAFLYLSVPSKIYWASTPLPAIVRWVGVATGMLSSLLMYWTLSSLGKNLTDTVVIRSNASLVTNGPYRWVRHPFYVTTALVMFSVTLISANLLIGAESILVLLLLVLRTPKEERALIDRFGQEYRDYIKVTGKFLPRWNRSSH